MTLAKLDALFPYVVFFYGAVMTFVLNSETLARIADDRLPSELISYWRGHRGLALMFLVVGACWILQNLWLT